VLFNTWKHHAGAIRSRIEAAAALGESGLRGLADQLPVVGTELMDLYTGSLTPVAIAERVLDILRANRHLDLAPYKAWLVESRSYGVVTFAEDSTRWVLRLGEEDGRYVHLHPARWAAQTRRVRANVLKTAILAQAHAAIQGGDPADVARINLVRKEFLGLSPIPRLAGDEGLGVILAELAVRKNS
jgi:hypothetical protein